jgi:hypothetical protein
LTLIEAITAHSTHCAANDSACDRTAASVAATDIITNNSTSDSANSRAPACVALNIAC